MEEIDARRTFVCAGADGPGPLQIRKRFLRAFGRRPGAAARGPHSGDELPALGRGGTLRRRRVRDLDAGNEHGARAATGVETARVGVRGPAATGEEHQRELRYRVLSAAWLLAAGIDPGGGRFD